MNFMFFWCSGKENVSSFQKVSCLFMKYASLGLCIAFCEKALKKSSISLKIHGFDSYTVPSIQICTLYNFFNRQVIRVLQFREATHVVDLFACCLDQVRGALPDLSQQQQSLGTQVLLSQCFCSLAQSLSGGMGQFKDPRGGHDYSRRGTSDTGSCGAVFWY